VSVEGKVVELEDGEGRFQAPLEYVLPTGAQPVGVMA